VTPLDILEPGGTLIIASECSEGMGSKEFVKAQELLVQMGPEAFLQTLTNKTLAYIIQIKFSKMNRSSYVDMRNSALTNNRNSLNDMPMKNSYYQQDNVMNANNKGFKKNIAVGQKIDDYLYNKRPYHLRYICKKCLSIN